MKNTFEQPWSIHQRKFHHLIDTICRAAGIDDSESLYENAVFRVDDVLFSLVHMDVLDPHNLVILADFGPAPPRQRDQAVRRLLESSVYTCDDDDDEPAICINPDNGHVLLLNRMPLTGISAKAILDLMASLVDLAKIWRASLVFEEPFMTGSMSRMLH